MHQTREGQQWHFGMKLHIGVDSKTGLAHSAVVTAANVHDKHAIPQLLHGAEREVWGDSAYASQQELIASKAPQAQDRTNRRVGPAGIAAEMERIVNRIKSKVRSRVEHVFAVVKRQWGFSKVRYKDLVKKRDARIRGAGSGQHLPGAQALGGMSPSAGWAGTLLAARKGRVRRQMAAQICAAITSRRPAWKSLAYSAQP